ncbi:hypothetical protein CYMTET_54896 [Cymbomonas tetramitiformis]|uniref:Myb-like domain-containing protein n=1 Tax=Cymbomonas tetramitiformis TaxID=36881 RepID=A0AAE0BF65_9CHLO|nr:hypothetical protein CYMTET_54896 [Cymbomonas tetramitiformis]
MGRATKYPGESEEEKRTRQRLATKKRVQKSRERQKERKLLQSQMAAGQATPADAAKAYSLAPKRGTGRLWDAAESDALRRGVCRYGVGKWQQILRDPELGPVLQSRSNVDLKDKWRCLVGRTPQTSQASSALVALAAGVTHVDEAGQPIGEDGVIEPIETKHAVLAAEGAAASSEAAEDRSKDLTVPGMTPQVSLEQLAICELSTKRAQQDVQMAETALRRAQSALSVAKQREEDARNLVKLCSDPSLLTTGGWPGQPGLLVQHMMQASLATPMGSAAPHSVPASTGIATPKAAAMTLAPETLASLGSGMSPVPSTSISASKPPLRPTAAPLLPPGLLPSTVTVSSGVTCLPGHPVVATPFLAPAPMLPPVPSSFSAAQPATYMPPTSAAASPTSCFVATAGASPSISLAVPAAPSAVSTVLTPVGIEGKKPAATWTRSPDVGTEGGDSASQHVAAEEEPASVVMVGESPAEPKAVVIAMPVMASQEIMGVSSASADVQAPAAPASTATSEALGDVTPPRPAHPESSDTSPMNKIAPVAGKSPGKLPWSLLDGAEDPTQGEHARTTGKRSRDVAESSIPSHLKTPPSVNLPKSPMMESSRRGCGTPCAGTLVSKPELDSPVANSPGIRAAEALLDLESQK